MIQFTGDPFVRSRGIGIVWIVQSFPAHVSHGICEDAEALRAAGIVGVGDGVIVAAALVVEFLLQQEEAGFFVMAQVCIGAKNKSLKKKSGEIAIPEQIC